MLLGNKGLGAYWVLANIADKALFMPLTSFVLHLLHAFD